MLLYRSSLQGKSKEALNLFCIILFPKVFIDPAGLEAGKVYFSAIKAYSTSAPDRGPMFEIPITVVVPLAIEQGHYKW